MPEDPESATVDLSTEGYTPLQHPGPPFRPVPNFTFDIPPGWIATDFADALCFVGTPDSLEGPWSNVFLQHERVLPTTALEEVAVESWDATLHDFPDATIVDERIYEFEQYQYVRECELTVIDELVTRVDAYWFGPDTEHLSVDLFRLVAMHPVEASPERTVEYLKMLRSFRFTGEPAPSGSEATPPTRLVAASGLASGARRSRGKPLVGRQDQAD